MPSRPDINPESWARIRSQIKSGGFQRQPIPGINPESWRAWASRWRKQYSLEELRQIYASPRTDLIEPAASHLAAVLRASTIAPTRFQTGFRPEQRLYKGSWYYQGQEDPICVPTCLMAAYRCLGLTPNFYILQQWYNHALGANARASLGTDLASVQTQMRRSAYRLQNYDRLTLELPPETARLHHAPIPYLMSSSWAEFLRLILRDPQADLDCFSRRVLADNARSLKQTLDSGQLFLACVGNETYYQSDNPGGHALLVVGYTVFGEGAMDLQTVDPSVGIVPVSLEHFTASLLDGPAEPHLEARIVRVLKAQRRSNLVRSRFNGGQLVAKRLSLRLELIQRARKKLH